jgi:hypothetical protein
LSHIQAKETKSGKERRNIDRDRRDRERYKEIDREKELKREIER